ncbi:tetratricopeptide repeat-containing sensor histidine kinase [Xanthomarina spongicola]|uniref:histidine kinase n=1 Tax=Xanthomarina spongicola TaxID=570520 RepID=A0A316DN06_9FLAO|nr:tetratricopeptide repeat protein [Xanthomarina spongicola]PWK18579.1 tetratricopeptide repeat protein [Xanthomarina spongicola]
MTFQFKFLIFLSLIYGACGFATCKIVQQKPVDSAVYYYYKVLKPDSKTDLLHAFVFYRNKKDENLKQQDTLNAIYNLRQIAIIQKKLGILYDSETTAIEALTLLEKLPFEKTTKESKAGIYNHLGRVYSEMQDYTNAIIYYKKALDIAETEVQDLVLRNNIAYAHIKEGRFSLALKEFATILNDSEKYNDSIIIARTLNNLGVVKGKLQDSTALRDFEKALEIRLSLGNNSDILGSYLDLSVYYEDKGDLVQSRYYAQNAYKLAKLSNNPTHLAHALSLLLDLKEDDEVHSYKQLMDSIQTANLLIEGKYASKKYALAKQEALANDRLLQLEKEKNYKYLYGFLAIFILSLGVITAFFQKHRFKKQKQLEIYNTELRISKKVHDEVANGVYHIMTKIQHEEKNNEAVLDDLEIIYNKTRDISREHNEIPIDENYHDLLFDILLASKSSEVNIIIKGLTKINWEDISDVKKITIYRVLQELMTNMSKHSQASLVVVDFKETARKTTISYSDNGIGCTLNKNNGLLNVENRIHTLNGSITFKSQTKQGFHVLISV